MNEHSVEKGLPRLTDDQCLRIVRASIDTDRLLSGQDGMDGYAPDALLTTVREILSEARLEGWVPLGTYVDVQVSDDRTFECSTEVDEAGLPMWERIVTRVLPPEETHA